MKAPPGYKWVSWKDMEPSQIIEDGADCYPWTECFFWWPVKSITGRRLFWTKGYKRKVWIVWGNSFHMEPETQYADAFDLLKIT